MGVTALQAVKMLYEVLCHIEAARKGLAGRIDSTIFFNIG